MQPLEDATNIQPDDLECASLVIETILLGMRTLRHEMRIGRPQNLSVPQFRMLAFLSRHQGASLSDAADHIGLTLPSTSRAVDCLVRQGLVERATSPDDRRRITLALSVTGSSIFQSIIDETRAHVAVMLKALNEQDRSDLVRGMDVLRSVFSQHWDARQNKS